MEDEKLDENQELSIPAKTDDTTFEMKDLKGSQKQITTYIFKRLFEWINRKPLKRKDTNKMSDSELKNYEHNQCKLTHMTISGAGGTGKSVLIKMLITAARQMFNRNDVAIVGAPTGCAGHNAGGETNHKLFAINSRSGEVTTKNWTY